MESASQSKVSRQKLVENSRQKFYDNLNQHMKDNKGALPVQEKSKAEETKVIRVAKTATSVTRKQKEEPPMNENQNKTNTVKPWGAAKPKVQNEASLKPPGQNKDLFEVASKKGNGMDQNKANPSSKLPPTNKTAPNFAKKAPDNNKEQYFSASSVSNSVANLTQTGGGKKVMSLRDQIFEQVKENVHNPKKLQEIQQNNTHAKIDFQQMIHQAKLEVVKENKNKTKTNTAEDDISKRIENSRKLLERLKQVSQPPLYATSILQSAIYNKSRILEAHLSTMSEDQRKFQVNSTDDLGRTAVFYSAYYGNIESVELLSAADASFNLTDKFHKTILHYASMNDTSKIIEACFLGFKSQGKSLAVYGQKDEDGNSPTKSIPPAAFSPFKSRFDEEDKKRKEDEARKKQQQKELEENDSEGFEIEDDQQQEEEEFKVENVDENEGTQKNSKMFSNLAGFFTKKAVLDVQDDKQNNMMSEMEKIDNLYIPQLKTKKQNQDEDVVGVPQVSTSSIINFRDLKGRTPLHIAVAFNNKNAVETLLFLNANPLIEDIYGQRPVEFALDDSIRDLLQNKMQRATQPVLTAMPKVKSRANNNQTVGSIIKPRKMSNASQMSTASQQQKKKANEQAQYPLDMKNLTIMIKEKIMIAKIGIENDNYLQYAIKGKALEACIYLMREVGGFDFLYKNSIGNTVLHLAIRTGSYKFVKMLFVKDYQDNCLDKPSPDDIFGNINNSSLKLLSVQNNKGYTPLLSAVDQGNFELFRFLLELYYYNEQISTANQKVLPKIINLKCDKGETCLLKAGRLNYLEMIYSLMHLGNDVVSYEVLTTVDISKKNILHYAVINKERELVQRLVRLDADKMELRLQGDSKNKTPQQYDPSNTMTELFNTVWDYSKEGNIRKLKLSIDSGKFNANDQTPWLKNTPLHIAVRSQQLESIKCLIYDYDADVTLENNLGKTVIQMATAIKDQALRNAILGLLNRIHTSTKVVRNLEAKKDKEVQKQRNLDEMNRLRQLMKDQIAARGLDLQTVFSMFDKNGDGVFQPLEFECAFIALDIEISKADLRRFISLTDTNKDGRVDFNEFYSVLYKEPVNEDMEKIAGQSEIDFEASFEEINQ